MSDLIRRKDAVSRISDLLMIELQGKRLPTWNEVYHAINDIPSAEPEQPSADTEQIAKVLNRSEGIYTAHGVSLCGHCENCGNAVCDEFYLCPYCGATLDWSE